MYVQMIFTFSEMILLITCYSADGVKYYCILKVIFQRRLLLNYLHEHTMYKMMEPFPTDDLDLQYVCYKGEGIYLVLTHSSDWQGLKDVDWPFTHTNSFYAFISLFDDSRTQPFLDPGSFLQKTKYTFSY